MENGKQVVDGNLEDIKKSLEGSLKRLKTDYIDLYYLKNTNSLLSLFFAMPI